MDEIIIKDNTIAKEIEKRIISIEKKMKQLKEQQDELKVALLHEMEVRNIIKIETDSLVVSYVAPTDRESFDSKKFREDFPVLYDDYVKISTVKSSIRVKVKA